MPKPLPLDLSDLDHVVGGSALYGTHRPLVNGGDGNDSIVGGAGAEEINGHRGDDLIDAGAGDDLIIGGIGQDTVLAGDGDDVVVWNPGDGNDSLDGGNGQDQLSLTGARPDDLVVRLADGTVLEPVWSRSNEVSWSFFPPPGASGTITFGTTTIQFSNFERIIVGAESSSLG